MNIVVISTPVLVSPPLAYGGVELVAALEVLGLSKLGNRVHLIAKEGSLQPPNGNLYTYERDDQLPGIVQKILSEERVDCWLDETHDKHLTEFAPDLPQLSRFQIMSLMGNPHCPVLISKGQRDEKFGGADWPIVYQSIDLDALPLYTGEREEFVLYLGQKIVEKRVGWTCETAIRSNVPLFIHGPGWSVDPEIDRYAEHPLIHNGGEVGGHEKIEKLQKAKALLHLVGANNWTEAGGIVVLESLAVGTPAIVTNNGCLGEYVTDGLNGYVVNSVEEAVDALQKVDRIRSEDCRASVERFDYRKNAIVLEELCRRVARGERWR